MHDDDSELFCVPSLSASETQSAGSDPDLTCSVGATKSCSRPAQSEEQLSLVSDKTSADDREPSAVATCERSSDTGVVSPQYSLYSSSLSSPKVQRSCKDNSLCSVLRGSLVRYLKKGL